MKCEELLHCIDDLANHRLDWVDADVVEHFESCEVCRLTVIQWKKTTDILAEAQEPTIPADLQASIIRAVEQEKNIQKKIIPAYWTRWVASLAAAIVVAVGVWVFYTPSTSPKMLKEDGVLHQNPVSSFSVSLYLPQARQVHLVGDFNNWDKTKSPLSKDALGHWTIAMQLDPGYYQYQLVVDGEKWVLDPHNPLQVADGFGGVNSGVYL